MIDIYDYLCHNYSMEKEQLEKLSIFELRDFARKIGVFNPTVLKKNDLICAIQDIQSGKVKPHVSKTKQGRPPKEFGRLANILMPEDILNIPTMQEKFYEPTQEETVFRSNYEKPEGAETFIYRGYFELLSNGVGLLRNKISSSTLEKECCFVSINIIRSYNIKEGDEIVCNAYSIDPNKPAICDEIISVNKIAYKDLGERQEFDNLSAVAPQSIDIASPLNQIGLKYGDTIFAYNNSIEDFANFVVKFASDNKDVFDNMIYLSSSNREDKYDILKGFPDELFIASYQESFSNQQRTSFMAINRAKRLVENEKNVCLFIQDILELVSLDNRNNTGELPVSKGIIGCAKNFEKGSLTIVCGFRPVMFPFMKQKIYTTFPILETCGLQITSKGVDIENSYRR